MNQYGKASRQKLATCHPTLRAIAEDALILSPYDITIIHGWRGEVLQNKLYDDNKSTKIFPDSRHNQSKDPVIRKPLEISDALDFGPYVNGGIPWDDIIIFAIIAGCFFSAAYDRGATIRYGMDWDSDGSTKDQNLMDGGHIELMTY